MGSKDTRFNDIYKVIKNNIARLGFEPKLTVHETVVLTTTQSRSFLFVYTFAEGANRPLRVYNPCTRPVRLIFTEPLINWAPLGFSPYLVFIINYVLTRKTRRSPKERSDKHLLLFRTYN